MKKYLVYRVIFLLPTLFVVTVLVFFLSRLTADNPMDKYCIYEEDAGLSTLEKEENCIKVLEKYGFNQPYFYFSIFPQSIPPVVLDIPLVSKRQRIKTILFQNDDYALYQKFEKGLNVLERDLVSRRTKGDIEELLPIYTNLRVLRTSSSLLDINSKQNILSQHAAELNMKYKIVNFPISSFQFSNFIPNFRWNGPQNQYNAWFVKILKGDLGRSYISNEKVSVKIYQAVKWTLLLNIIAVFFIFLIGIPLGLKVGAYPDTTFAKWTEWWTLLLFSLPTFWVASLLITFFTTEEFGSWLNLFPTGGLGKWDEQEGVFSNIMNRVHHLILPVFCLVYGSIAYLQKQLSEGIKANLNRKFTKFAYTKGLAKKDIIWNYGFKNSLYPIITIIGSIIPDLIGGSVILEVIFRIPGIGHLVYKAMLQHDWPIVFAVTLISSALTILGLILSDLLYKRADPRAKLEL